VWILADVSTFSGLPLSVCGKSGTSRHQGNPEWPGKSQGESLRNIMGFVLSENYFPSNNVIILPIIAYVIM